MSSNLAYAAPRRDSRRETVDAPRPRRVHIVTTRAQRRARPKLVYALGAVIVIFVIFIAQLLLTIALSSGAYTISDLQITGQQLGRTSSALKEKLDTLGSSQNLQANALALGMVNSSQAGFIRLSNGSVLGAAAAAGAATPVGSDSVPNSLLIGTPLIKSTGAGHGGANAAVSGSSNSQSTEGAVAPVSTGSVTPASTAAPNSGDLPSPVTH